ncbi:ribosomal protein S12 methylthiotransferase accessory factor [Caloranaerobacter azorensis DSM 13643]|uniref:Ribosomal protein S12 methylthiotransferase accessory factor n=1 Tax=Caloranaerobacter azorensis DSM 13643 TaxID=1121264 RepID=A0A1M5UQR2_9FIRM|nr:YcaO-like family protein [Caloranaerobacter azorensis]SHH65392.1 ribosomal protein S12 methylthiotransferase accessory factor [Caloranaerobacter azorensis DSM 13643]
MYIIDKYNFSIEKKRIFKNVECTVCSRENSDIKELFSHFNEDYLFSNSYRSKHIEDIIYENEDIFSELVNKDTGIGYRIFRDVSSNIIPMYCVKSYIRNREFYSYGRNSDVIYSKYAAIFEMIERYSTIVPHFNGSIYGSYNELKIKFDNILNPKEFTMPDKSQFSEEGYSLKVYDDNKKYYWRKVYEINSKEMFWIPEQMIFFDNQIINEEERFIYETSNGSALGANLEEAILYALFEVVERDSFLVHWYNKMSPIRLNIDEIDNVEINNIIKYLEKKGYSIYLFDITLETQIPTIWALVVDEKDIGRVKAYNAAGSHINPEKALESALVEIVTSLSVYNEILSTPEKIREIQKLIDNPSAVTKMEYHVYFYSLKENFKYLEFVFKNNPEIKFKDAYYEWYEAKEKKHTLSDIIFKVSKNHPRIYIADTNSYITKELSMSSVKVIIPSMLTMTFGNQNRRLNYERILTAPIIAGKKRCPIDVKDINLIPHPFP